MARKCYYTGIGTKAGNNRSHSLHATRRKWKANLQKVRIVDEKGRIKRVYVSTRAMRAGLVPCIKNGIFKYQFFYSFLQTNNKKKRMIAKYI